MVELVLRFGEETRNEQINAKSVCMLPLSRRILQPPYLVTFLRLLSDFCDFLVAQRVNLIRSFEALTKATCFQLGLSHLFGQTQDMPNE